MTFFTFYLRIITDGVWLVGSWEPREETSIHAYDEIANVTPEIGIQMHMGSLRTAAVPR
jgi:hypothetical protein